ncbi:MAG: CRISPR-associated endoribonuclease Cas6 [Chloroflexota bacterium]
MQINFTFKSDYPLILPIQYNHILQAFIYNSIDEELASFLHHKGFIVNKRPFKLFTFSRLTGNYSIDKESQTINFGQEYQLKLASPLEIFCRSLCQCILTKKENILGKTMIQEVQIEIDEPKASGGSINVQTRSPITAYSTLLKADGAKYTCYFQPGETDFNRIVTENLKKKYEAVYKQTHPGGEIIVQPLSQQRQSIIMYKDFVIKGYFGRYRISGPDSLLQIALDAGIGSKNSQGFGFIELMTKR